MQIRSLTALASKFLVLALVLAGAAWAADSNAGTWKLNTAKSTYSPGPAPTSNTVTIVAVDNGIHLTANGVDAAGKPTHVEYTAAGSFAVGLIFGECVRHAGSLRDNDLLAAAAELDCFTLYGRFRLDSAGGRQVGHRILLVQWDQDHKVLLSAAEPPIRR